MIFRREMKRNLKSLLIWSCILSGLVIMMLSLYPQMAADQQAVKEMMDVYPEPLKKAFGMDKINFGSILGFFAIEVYMMTTLVGSIYAAMLASGILVKEENDKTIEFLLSKPVNRSEIVLHKLGAVIANLLLFNIILTLTSLLGFQFADGAAYSGKVFALLAFATFILHLTIAAVSFLMSAIMRRTRNILSLSLGFVFISYFLNITAGVAEKFAFLKYVSFFKYVDAGDIIVHESIRALFVWIMLIVTVLCISTAFMYYKKKDIAV
ncbi:MAG: ABC transporter permease subunit [Paenibacillaceae bacterium]